MNENRVTDWILVIKEQIASQEILLEYHLKVESMVGMLLAKDLANYPTVRLHNYLWTISDLMNKATDLNEALLSRLLQALRQYGN